MANRKLGPVEGDLCWFCKMPSDDEAWMGLGILKSTREPVFDGHYILYHECCAVYSCGAEDTPPTGMADASVLKFYRHGEKAAGIGLKCQLCGKRGATTGCFYGPCQQFYHFPCARARAYQGYLRFSLDGKRLACMEHAPLLPLPHEVDFMGMWMEGVGSWNGSLMELSREQWHPNYSPYATQFLQRWGSLLSMTPAADIRAMQDMAKGSRRNIKAKGNSSKTKEDPDYRVKGGGSSRAKKGTTQQPQPGRTSSSGGGAAAPASAAAGVPRHSSSSGGGGRRKGGKAKHAGPGAGVPTPGHPHPQRWGVGGGLGVPADIAAAAERGQQYGGGFGGFGGAAAAAGFPATSRSSMLEGAGGSGELFSPTSAFSRQQQYPGQVLQGPVWEQQGGQHSHQHSGQHTQQQQQHYQQQWQGGGADAAAAVGVAPATGGYGGAPGYARSVAGERPGAAVAAAAAAAAGGGFSSGGGDGVHALQQLLRQAAQGSDLPHQPGISAGNAAAVKPEFSCQLLLAAAGFEPETHAVPDWPGQRASAAGQYANQQQDWAVPAAAAYTQRQQQQQQQQQQRDSMLAAAGPGFPAGRGPSHNPSNMLHTAPQAAAAAAGDGTAGRPAAAAGGGLPVGSSAARGNQGLGRSTSGASSADSAPNGGNHPHPHSHHNQPGQLRNLGSHQDQQQQQWRLQPGGVTSVAAAAAAAGQSGGVFRYNGGVLVGPGGPEEPLKQRKLLDLNVLARTGRKQLSLGVVKLDSHPQQQQQQQQVAGSSHQVQVKREVQQQQLLQPPQHAAAAAAGSSQPSLSNADMLQQIAAAMKAVTEAEGDQQTQALATAAAMIAAAAAAQAGGSSSGGGGGVGGLPAVQQQQQQQGAGGQPQDVENEVWNLLRQQFGAP